MMYKRPKQTEEDTRANENIRLWLILRQYESLEHQQVSSDSKEYWNYGLQTERHDKVS